MSAEIRKYSGISVSVCGFSKSFKRLNLLNNIAIDLFAGPGEQRQAEI
jgi:hypothetical protein